MLRRCIRKSVRCWRGAVLFGVLAGCVTAPPTDPWSQAQLDPQEVRRFRQIVEHLAHPAMEGRGAGTAGLEKTTAYLVERFQALGLTPAFLIDGRPTYTQPFEIQLGVSVQQQSLALMPGAVGEGDEAHPQLTTQPDQQFSCLGFSANGSFEGPTVFVGYGIVNPEKGYDSYQGVPEQGLEGAVAIAFRYEPLDDSGRSQWAGLDPNTLGPWTQAAGIPQKAQWAAQRGAAALLVVNPPSQDRGDLKLPQRSITGQRATIPVFHISTALFDRMIRRTGRDPTKVAQAFQQRADRSGGGVEWLAGVRVKGTVKLTHRSATIANVAGFVPGRGRLADQVVVVGAHYDHLGYGEIGSLSRTHAIHPGADDNASGVAGLLLLAQRLCDPTQQKDRASDAGLAPTADTPCRSVLFVAFTGEERGLLGSSYLMKHLDDLRLPPATPGAAPTTPTPSTTQPNTSPRRLEHTDLTAMINYDMIGRMDQAKLHVMGTGSGDRWSQLLDQANQTLGLDLQTTTQTYGGSDHMSFQVREVPALHFFTGSHEDYHRTTDTPDKINAGGAVAVVALTDVLLGKLRDEPKRLAFTGMPPSMPHGLGVGEQGQPGRSAYLGVMPEYTEPGEEAGCGLSGVIPGSPAQAAGLRADDTILTWNGQPVRGARGLSIQLRQSQPGDEVVLEVRRRNKIIQLKATLGQRSAHKP